MKMKCRAEVKEIRKKTKAQMFENVQVGDIIEFSVPLERSGRNRDRTYASYIDCLNTRTGEETGMSFNQIGRFIDEVFVWEEVNE